MNRKLWKQAFYIGVSGFGGPAILGFIKKEFVEKEKAINEKEFYSGLSLSQIVPGATAGNMLTFITSKSGTLLDILMVQFFFLLPAILSMLLFTYIYFTFGSIDVIKKVFDEINVAVVAMMLITLEKVVLPLAKKKLGLALLLTAFLLKFFFNANFLLIMVVVVAISFFEKDKGEIYCVYGLPPFPKKEAIAAISFFILSFALLFSPSLLAKAFTGMERVGLLAFGGGFAAIPIIHEFCVNIYGWLTQKEFINGIALAQITPGPILNISTFAGYKLAGIPGAFAASAGMFLPGFFLMVFLSKYSDFILSKPFFKKISSGIVLTFNGILIFVAYKFMRDAVTSIESVILLIVLSVLQFKFKLNPLILIFITIVYTLVKIVLLANM